MLSVEQSSELP